MEIGLKDYQRLLHRKIVGGQMQSRTQLGNIDDKAVKVYEFNYDLEITEPASK